MRLRNIMIGVVAITSIFTAITYTSCKKDACENVLCLNLGACDQGKCTCPVGFEGERCEILSREKFIKRYNGRDTCMGSTKDTTIYYTYPIDFRAETSNPRVMVMKNILNSWEDSAYCTMQGTDSFYFSGSNNSLTYSGTGKMRNDSLWLVYHVERDTSAYDCRFFGQGLR